MDLIIKDIKGFEGLYAVTNDGRVWSHKSNKWLKLRGSGKKYLKILKDELRNYRTIVLRKNNRPFYFYIHRLVAENFIENPLNKMMVNHIDGNPLNNNVINLEWVTREENTKHAFENGLTTRGIRNSQTILTEEQVKEIKQKYIPKIYSSYKLAKEYLVSQGTISAILTGRNWNYI